jgi:hypothetical protein
MGGQRLPGQRISLWIACLLVVGSRDSSAASAGANAWSLKEKVSETKEHLADQRLKDLANKMRGRPIETPALHPHLQIILARGRNLSIYIPFPLGRFVNKASSSKAYVRGAAPWEADPTQSLEIVPKASSWLWVHSEYEMTAYMLERIKREMRIVPTAAEADICFLSCEQNISHLVRPKICDRYEDTYSAQHTKQCVPYFFRGKSIMTNPHQTYLVSGYSS